MTHISIVELSEARKFQVTYAITLRTLTCIAGMLRSVAYTARISRLISAEHSDDLLRASVDIDSLCAEVRENYIAVRPYSEWRAKQEKRRA